MANRDIKSYGAVRVGPFVVNTVTSRKLTTQDSKNFIPGTFRVDRKKHGAFSCVNSRLASSSNRQVGVSGITSGSLISCLNINGAFDWLGVNDNYGPGYPFSVGGINNRGDYDFTRSRIAADNLAYARFYRGKKGLLAGGASLGVTAASWKQSRDMIVGRFFDVRRLLDKNINRLVGDPKRAKALGRKRELLANDVLEEQFGWEPLIADIHAALYTVVKDASVGRFYHKSSGKSNFTSRNGYGDDWTTTQQVTQCEIRTSYAATVEVQNFNHYMLNRLGLINPADVVWDLIPWSWVVGMFVNIQSFVRQVTDDVGLSVTNESVTRTARGTGYSSTTSRVSSSQFQQWHTAYAKRRIVNAPLQVQLQTRIPSLDWNLAVIAGSVVLQRFQRVNKLVGFST